MVIYFNGYVPQKKTTKCTIRLAAGHYENMSMRVYPLEPQYYISKTGVYRGTPIFLIFDSKHRLWVLIRTKTASARRFYCVPTINVLSKMLQISFFFSNEFFNFYS